MNPTELTTLGYPSNISTLIEACEGVSLLEETNNYYLIYDNYEQVDRVLHINKKPGYKEDYFEFFTNDVDQDAIRAFAITLPSLLFMNLKKVYFVEQEEDLINLDEESPNHTFSFSDQRKPVGMATYRDSTAFINLRQLKESAKEEVAEDLRILGYSEGERAYILRGICSTLAHELFHLMQFNPLIEGYIPEGEKPAEDFCRHYA